MVLFNQLSRLTEGLQQVSVPGEIEITLAEPGTYTIFHEHQSVVGDRVYRNEEGLPGLKVALVSAGGAHVALSPATVSSNYSVGGRAGVSVLGFSTDEPGPYRLSAWYPEGQGGPQGVLAIGRGFTATLLRTIFGVVGLFLGSTVVGGTIAVLTFLRRRRARGS